MTELMEDLEAVERLCCRLETHLEDRKDLHTAAHLVTARALWRMLRREARRERRADTQDRPCEEKEETV